jgi:hypothetical protein
MFGADIVSRPVGFDLFAQMPHEHAQRIELLAAALAPESGEQGAMRDDLAGTLREINQQVEFLRSEMNFARLDQYRAALRVDISITLAGGPSTGEVRRRAARIRAINSIIPKGLVT